MVTKKSRNETRQKRHLRIRKNISGTSSTPRLAVYRSNANIYAQVIDDVTKTTLVAASSSTPPSTSFSASLMAAENDLE